MQMPAKAKTKSVGQRSGGGKQAGKPKPQSPKVSPKRANPSAGKERAKAAAANEKARTAKASATPDWAKATRYIGRG
jgi:hypothetical protein